MNALQLTAAKVNFDGSNYFDGYVSDTKWNGFECPYFERTEAEKVLDSAEGIKWHYNPIYGEFVVFTEEYPDDPDIYKRSFIDGKVVYAIGSYGWSWQKAE